MWFITICPLSFAGPIAAAEVIRWTDVTTAESSVILAATAVIAGAIALYQLYLFRQTWRIRNTFSLVKAYTAKWAGLNPYGGAGLAPENRAG